MNNNKEIKTPLNASLISKLVSLAKPYKIRFILCALLSILLAGVAPLRPLLTEYAIDNIPTLVQENKLVQVIVGMVLLLFMESILKYIFIYFSALLGQLVVTDLRKRVFNHVIHLNPSYFDTTPIGTSTTRTISDVETINDIYSENFFTIISDVLTILVVLGVMFYQNWQLTLISVIPFPFIIWATYSFKENVKKSFQKVREKISEMNAFLQEHISGMKIIQLFNAEEKEFSKFEKINEDYTKANIESIWHYSVYFPIVELILAASVGLMVSYGVYLATGNNNLKVGEITSFFMFLNMLFRPMRFLADKFNTLQMGFVASERVFKLLEREETIQNNGTISNGTLQGSIAFKKVAFSYNPEHPVLKGISFDIEAGKMLALIGATGSGKTSIINNILRYYEIQEGEILIDNKNVNDYEISFLRNQIGIVLQDVFLFSGTIYENITLFNPEISREKVIEVSKKLGVHEFIMAQPNGYNYLVKERGATLSLGQRQLISFVRALVTDPKILILDEATSSIDVHTEDVIQKAIERMVVGRTSIVIAHRLSTIIKADKILILDKGIIIDEGTHHDLINRSTFYKSYFEGEEKEALSA